MFKQLEDINSRPAPFQFYTAEELWTSPYTAKQMLSYHLDGSQDFSSRKTEFIERSAEWIASRFELGSQKKVADFGCGPGLYASRLASRGAAMTGIDFSANSLEYARKSAKEQNLKINYVLANYLEYDEAPGFDLITMIMCDFCALSPAQRQILLAKFYAALKPGGSLLLDVYSMHAFAQREESATYELNHLNSFWSPDDYYCFCNTFKYEQENVVLDKFTIVEAAQQRVVYNWLQYFSQESLQAELEASGLAVEELMADVAGAPFSPEASEFAVIARKPQ